MNSDDRFQAWLMEMDDSIGAFINSIPPDTAARLDFSPGSLDAIEGFALKSYSTIADVKRMTEAKVVDGMARYVGQVFRKHLGGKWGIDFSDQRNAFYGLPQLFGMAGQRAQICPLTLVTAAVDRRTGSFVRTVFETCLQNAAK